MQECSGCCLNWFTAFYFKKVCNHKRECHCNPGWAPPYCDIQYADLPQGTTLWSHLGTVCLCGVLVVKVVKRKAITIAQGVNCYSGVCQVIVQLLRLEHKTKAEEENLTLRRTDWWNAVPLQFPHPEQMQKLMKPLCFLDTAWFWWKLSTRWNISQFRWVHYTCPYGKGSIGNVWKEAEP